MKHVFRDTRLQQNIRRGCGDQRCLLRRFGEHGISGRERARDLTCEDRQRKIPWRDAGEDAAPVQRQFVQFAGRAFQPLRGGELFPRTDAAIIVGITDDDDRLLLGSNALWETNRFSLLAGFVEPGESLEAAVIREVFEESGVHVVDPIYKGSQPWPFPASLMVGFRARIAPGSSTVGRPDGEEILELRWFSRDKLAAANAAGDIRLPGSTSIARAIIALGHSLDLKVIAEGVETPQQLAFLREHHCDVVQGFLFGAPITADEMAALLRQGLHVAA